MTYGPVEPGTQLHRLLETAHSYLGLGEEGSSNSGPFVERLFRGHRTRGAWCAAFVATCLEETGVCPVLPDRKRRGAKALTRYVAEGFDEGSWAAGPQALRPYVPSPGDLICWHVGGRLSWRGHVELVASYDAETNSLRTVGGNAGAFPSVVKYTDFPAGTWTRRLWGASRLDFLYRAG